jgi:prophage regulatory protein
MSDVNKTARTTLALRSAKPDPRPLPVSNDQRISRLPDVLEAVKLSASTVFRMVKAKSFPAPIQLSQRNIAWRTRDLELWLSQRAAVPVRDSSITAPVRDSSIPGAPATAKEARHG